MRGLTLKELSAKSGVPIKTIYAITANDPNTILSDTMERLCSALDVTTLYLFGRKDMDYANRIRDLFELPEYRLEYNEEDAGAYLIDRVNNIYIEPSAKEIDALTSTISAFSRFTVNELFQKYIKNGKTKIAK